MTGSAIIDLPTLFIGVLALLLAWDIIRTFVILVLQAASLILMWRCRTLSATEGGTCTATSSPAPSCSSSSPS